MNLAKSSVKLAAASGGRAVITFAGIALFARLLPPSELGVFFLFEAVLGMLLIPADFGIRGALQKRISEGTNPGQMLTAAVLLKAIPLSLVAGIILLAAPLINDYVGANIAVWLVVAIIGYESFQLSIDVLSGELRVGETASVRLAQKVIWLIVGFSLVEFGYGVHGLIYGTIVGYAVSFLWGMYRRTTTFRRPSFVEARSLFSYSRYNFISAISGYFYNWIDVIFIGLFLTTTHVSAYEAAWRVTAVAILGSTAIAKTIFPQVSRWDAEEAITRIERLIPRTIVPALILVVPAFFGALLFSREILRFVFTPEYTVAWLVLVILMWEKLFQSIHSITGRALRAIDRPDLAARAAVFAIGVNLVLNIPLIQFYGIVGAAVATAVSFIVNSILCIRYLSRFLTVKIPWTDLGWVVASSLGMTLVLLAIESAVRVDSLLRLLFIISVGALVYAGLIFASPPLRTQIRRSARMLRSNQSRTEAGRGDD